MYRLPPKDELSFLSGATLTQICIGANEMILHFQEDISITVEDQVSFEHPGGRVDECSDALGLAAAVIPLLHQKVAEVDRVDDLTLAMVFERGTRMQLRSTSDQYESYLLRHGRNKIVI